MDAASFNLSHDYLVRATDRLYAKLASYSGDRITFRAGLNGAETRHSLAHEIHKPTIHQLTLRKL
jgi:hypothetical protein